jgi:hypothetical protein
MLDAVFPEEDLGLSVRIALIEIQVGLEGKGIVKFSSRKIELPTQPHATRT